jgi:hypothetical protein
MHTYDTNFFIKKVLLNEDLFKKILKEFINSQCIILRSIREELIFKHIIYISSELQKFREEIKKHSFEKVSQSLLFLSFKDKYQEIGEYIEKNCKNKDIKIINKLIDKIHFLEVFLSNESYFYPSLQSEYDKIKQSEKYKFLLNRIKENDNKHLALLELYGEQINKDKKEVIRIKFISCDKDHIVSAKAKNEIMEKFCFIEPIDCEEWEF